MAKGKHSKKTDIKKCLINLITLFLVIILITSVTYILDAYLEAHNESKEVNELLENTQIVKSEVEEEKTERMLQLQELQKVNSEIVAWIQINDTNINNPVMQTDNNDYYLTHNYKKEYNEKGSLFLDKDYDWNIPSSNLLIYGHSNTIDSSMFSDLSNYKKESFYKEHQNILFTTMQEDATYEIISVFLSRVYYQNEENVFRYYFFVNANTEEEYNEYVKNCKDSALYDTGKTAQYGDQLLTLSTCDKYTQDGRLVIVARKV